MNALLSPHRRVIWVAWLVAALLFLAVGNGLIYGLIVPLSAGLLVLLAPGLVSSAGRLLMVGTLVLSFCCTSLLSALSIWRSRCSPWIEPLGCFCATPPASSWVLSGR